MFVCYGASIEDQFEFLTRRWANSPIQPNFGGHDPIIGQRDRYGDRSRSIDFPTAAGAVRIESRTMGDPYRRRLLLRAADQCDRRACSSPSAAAFDRLARRLGLARNEWKELERQEPRSGRWP